MDEALIIKVSETLWDLYCLYHRRWVRIADATETDNPFCTVRKMYDLENIEDHVVGKYAFGVFAGEKATKFISIDIDDGEAETVHRVVDTMEEMGVPRERIYVSFSGRKGYHVDIFFNTHLSNYHARIFYEVMIERGGFDRKKVEFRPTHTQAIKIPLGIHPATKKRCWYVDRETLEPIERFEYVFEIQKIDWAEMKSVVHSLWSEHMQYVYNDINGYQKPEMKRRSGIPGNYGSLVVTAPGTRHELQKKVAARARMDGCDYFGIVEQQLMWYENQNKALIRSSESEVRKEAEELAKWAIKAVEIKDHSWKPSELKPVVEIRKEYLPYILRAPRSSYRRVAFFLCVYAVKYGEVKLSIKTIAEQVHMSESATKLAIEWLRDEKFIGVENRFRKYDRILTVRASNKYTFPGEKKMRSPNKKDLRLESLEIMEWLTPENFDDVFISTMAKMCQLEYLERFLTKVEVEKCKTYLWKLQNNLIL